MAAVLVGIGYVVAVWVAAIVLSYGLSFVGIPKADFAARVLAYFLSMLVSSIYGVIASVFLRLVGYGQLSQWAVARSFKYNMLVTAGVTFDVEDPNGYLEKIRPAVFIGPLTRPSSIKRLAEKMRGAADADRKPPPRCVYMSSGRARGTYAKDAPRCFLQERRLRPPLRTHADCWGWGVCREVYSHILYPKVTFVVQVLEVYRGKG
ncbi:putative 1-acyl-sn-glycerol-3-phosphate acyltransferase [Madurella mycetomatis]|uniref:1-acyl-sn-glycerol-3-phosphate acyltransferase n=1 Tax=Madurella mycetomatis TaxID=100816 RepID=A0A175VN32_9PEZI|nr:putative 1-acyl-sn-glycerol-3-phosphate acyltransferase [Madurella mycetomatis]